MSSHHRLPSLNSLRQGAVAALLGFCWLGIAQGQTVFWSNLVEEKSVSKGPSFRNLRQVNDVAQSFTTGNSVTTLVSITLSIDSITIPDTAPDSVRRLYLDLYTDSSLWPGTKLERLSNSAIPMIGGNTYTSIAQTVLDANTTYWWVASADSYNVASSYTFDMTTSTSGESSDAWSTGEAYISNTYDQRRGWSSWISYGDDSFKFEIVANSTSQVPEPATTVALAGLITLGVAACSRRRRR